MSEIKPRSAAAWIVGVLTITAGLAAFLVPPIFWKRNWIKIQMARQVDGRKSKKLSE